MHQEQRVGDNSSAVTAVSSDSTLTNCTTSSTLPCDVKSSRSPWDEYKANSQRLLKNEFNGYIYMKQRSRHLQNSYIIADTLKTNRK